VAIVNTEITAGTDSLIMTLNMICISVAPNERAASINCLSTFIKLLSSKRAIKAVAATDKGKITAFSPIYENCLEARCINAFRQFGFL